MNWPKVISLLVGSYRDLETESVQNQGGVEFNSFPISLQSPNSKGQVSNFIF